MAKSNFNLSDFKSSIKLNGISRNSRFEITFTPPIGVPGLVDSREISIRCHTGSLPPINIKTKDYIDGQGQIRKMPVNYDHGHVLTFTFYNDVRSRVYSGLLAWSNNVAYTPIANDHRINYYNNFTGSIDVKQLDEQDNVRYAYKLFEAYPITVHQVDLKSDEHDTAQLITVDFAYRYARSLDAVASDDIIATQPRERETVVRKYFPSGTDEPINPTIKQQKGKGVSTEEKYQQCLNTATETYLYGNEISPQLREINEQFQIDISDALLTQDKQINLDMLDSIKNRNGAIFVKTSDFFARTANVELQYQDLSSTLSPVDPLHTEISILKSTYATVSAEQSSIDYTISSYERVIINTFPNSSLTK